MKQKRFKKPKRRRVTTRKRIVFLIVMVMVMMAAIVFLSEDGEIEEEEHDEWRRDQTYMKHPQSEHPKATQVLIENRCGEDLDIYWDDGENGHFVRSLEDSKQSNLNTFYGHTLYLTPKGSSASKDNNILERLTISEQTPKIIVFFSDKTKNQHRRFLSVLSGKNNKSMLQRMVHWIGHFIPFMAHKNTLKKYR